MADDNRVTRDADFLGHGDADPDRLVADFREIMAIESDDGLVFDIAALAATAIRGEMEYGGVRLKTAAYLEKTRIPVAIDIGFGDAMADATQRLDYPTLLDFPVPQVRSYPPATVIAEKYHAMVALGVLNGRMKDYYDLWAIPRAIDISDEDLDAAIRVTFERRGTPIPDERPPGLSAEMAGDQGKQKAMACLCRIARTRRCFVGIPHRSGLGTGRPVMRADRCAKRRMKYDIRQSSREAPLIPQFLLARVHHSATIWHGSSQRGQNWGSFSTTRKEIYLISTSYDPYIGPSSATNLSKSLKYLHIFGDLGCRAISLMNSNPLKL